MNRSEMVDAVERLVIASGSEAELDHILEMLILAVPHGGISDLIYHSEGSLIAERIVDTALRREHDWRSQAVREQPV